MAGMVNGGGYEKRFKSVRKVVLSIGISPTLLASSGKNEDIVKIVDEDKREHTERMGRSGNE